MFPSPCGVNIVGNPLSKKAKLRSSSVSVPLRGKYCRESDASNESIKSQQVFPSPCGVNIVGNLDPTALIFSPEPALSFRPLAG